MRSEYFINKELFRKHFITLLEEIYVIDFNESNLKQQYNTLVELIKRNTSNNWNKTKKNTNKKLYYFCSEINLGKSLYTNIINSGIKEVIEEAFLDLNINLEDLLNLENDFESEEISLLDSLTTSNLLANVFSVRTNKSNLEIETISEEVKFYGNVYFKQEETLKCIHECFDIIETTAYECPVIGYNNNVVNTITRWDTNFTGLKRDYLYISASLQTILKNNDINNIVINITDQSSLVVVELMRLLMDDYNYSWSEAYTTTKECVIYNKTSDYTYNTKKFCELLPRLYTIVEELNNRNNCALIDEDINISEVANTFNLTVYNYEGLSHRKWCLNINNELSDTLNEYALGWIQNPNTINNLNKSISKRRLQKKFRDMKVERKKSLYNEINHNFVESGLLAKIENNILSIVHILYLHNQLKYNTSFKENFTPITFLITFEHNLLLNLNNDCDTNSYLKIIEIKNYNETLEQLIVTSVDIVDKTNAKYLLNGVLSVYDNLVEEEFNEFSFLLNEYNLEYDDNLKYFNSYKKRYSELNELNKDEVLWCREMINTTLKSINHLSDNKVEKLNNEIFKLNKVKIN